MAQSILTWLRSIFSQLAARTRSLVGRLPANLRPALERLSAFSRPVVGRLLAGLRPVLERCPGVLRSLLDGLKEDGLKTKITFALLGGAAVAVLMSVFDSQLHRQLQQIAAPGKEQAQEYMSQSFPNVKVDRVMPTDLGGFQAVVADGRVYYMSNDGAFLMAGSLFDLQADVNMTERIKAVLRKESIANIQSENLLTYAPDDYQHVVRVFSDVDCPYCRKLHGELPELQKGGVRVDYIVVPFRGDEARRKAVSVWCSDNRREAMDKGMRGAAMDKAECDDHPIEDNLRLARALGVTATPAFLLEDGRLLVGYRPAQELLHDIKNPPVP